LLQKKKKMSAASSESSSLSNFRAFKDAQLMGKVSAGKLRTFATYKDKMYVGTKDGHVLLYSVLASDKSTANVARYESELLKKKSLGRGKKPVQQLECIGALGQLAVLCDGRVEMLEMRSLDSLKTLTLPKSAGTSSVGLFCSGTLSSKKGIRGVSDYHVCVQAKRKLYLYRVLNLAAPIKEIALQEAPVRMVWRAGRVYMAFRRTYAELNLADEQLTMLAQFSSRSEPQIKLLRDGVLCVVDGRGHVYSFESHRQRVPDGGIAWRMEPIAIGYRHPYVIGVHRDASAEVHNVVDGRLMQTMGGAGWLAVRDDGDALMVASHDGVYVLPPVAIGEQVRALLADKRVDRALDLFAEVAGAEPDYETRLRDVHRDAATVLFCNMQFALAFRLWTTSSVDPRDVIAFYPDLLVGELRYRSTLTMPPLSLGSLGDADSSSGSLSIGAVVHANMAPGTGQAELRRHIDDAHQCLTRYLGAMLPHLAVSFERAVAVAVQTALLKLFAELHPERLGSLLPLDVPVASSSSPSASSVHSAIQFVHFDDAKRWLEQHRCHHALGRLCAARGHEREALDVWKQIGFGKLKSDAEPKISTQSGTKSTVALLSRTGDEQLVWEYAKWILDYEHNLGIAIFTSTQRGTPLSPVKVLEFLSPRGAELRQSYLEYLIEHERNEEERYHTKLALLYLDTIIPLLPSGGGGGASSAAEAPVPAGSEGGLLGRTRLKLVRLLDTSTHYNVATVLTRVRDVPLHDEQVILYSKLGQHIVALELLVHRFKDAERAEAYCQRHSRADPDVFVKLLRLYLDSMSASGASSSAAAAASSAAALAAAYEEDDGEGVAGAIVDAEQLISSAALKLLNSYGHKLSPVAVMRLLPPSMPLVAILRYLRTTLAMSHHKYRDGQVMHNLLKAENYLQQERIARLQEHFVIIDQHTLCHVCEKRIGDRVFARYPNGVIVHFKCFSDPHVDPLTQRNFLERPFTLASN
jgi:Vacuolar sorting protein 39 domain 2/CNH domain/Vacuolar sorting protein 39 domain 1